MTTQTEKQIMKTITSHQIAASKDFGAEWLATTTVWNFHTAGIPSSLNSNLVKKLISIFDTDDAPKHVTILVGSKGWSGHSATELNIFDTSDLDDEQIAEFSGWSNASIYDSYELIDASHSYYQETGRNFV